MSGINWIDIVNAIASVATAIGVLLAWRQIKLAKQQATVAFEDELTREYREIMRQIPVRALLVEELDEKEFDKAFPYLYQYIDLTNEQVFLRQNGRIGRETWENWREGIKSNLLQVTFRKAWEEMKSRAHGSFEELRRLEQSDFKDDPHSWK